MHSIRCIGKFLISPRANASIANTFHQRTCQLSSVSRKTSASKMMEPIEGRLSEDIIKQLGKPPRIRPTPAFTAVNSQQFQNMFTPELQELVELFNKYDYELRIAGGAVRDILMNIQPSDIDFATTATPDQMKEMFNNEEIRMINAKGEKHGTITARINNKENFEITTLRIDVRTDGRHADVVFTTDWLLDALRRDLTMNSMFMDFKGVVYDHFYGYEDLMNKRVLFVGDANIRIKEDYLRILRYFRFFGRIALEGQKLEKETEDAIKANAAGLEHISGERIWSELQKILRGMHVFDIVTKIINCGCIQYCGLPKLLKVEEFGRVCNDLKGFEEDHNPILYMIAFLETTEDAVKLHERLKLSAYDRDLALFITQQRDIVDVEYTCLLDYQKLCLQPYVRREFVEELLKYKNKKELYNELKEWEIPIFPINGNTLKTHGLNGKKLGRVLVELRLMWAESEFQMTADQLMKELPTVLLSLGANSPQATPTKKPRS